MIKYIILIFGLVSIISLDSISGQINENWCDLEKNYCDGQPHIGCNTTQLENKCVDEKFVEITDELKDTILNLHNYFRNQISTGKIPPYPKAKRMREMVWDKELGYLASLHVKKCNGMKDGCRSTYDSDGAGQSIGFRYNSKDSVKEALQKIITEWFIEKRQKNLFYVDRIPYNGNNNFLNFVQMIIESNFKIGCAYITFARDTVMLTCNYDSSNRLNRSMESVYIKGDPCSDCYDYYGLGCSLTFPGLCSSTEYPKENERIENFDHLIKEIEMEKIDEEKVLEQEEEDKRRVEEEQKRKEEEIKKKTDKVEVEIEQPVDENIIPDTDGNSKDKPQQRGSACSLKLFSFLNLFILLSISISNLS